MTDLCSICGASWDCEHRPAVTETMRVADPFGPDVAVFEQALPSKLLLMSKIRDKIELTQRSSRDELMEALGFEVPYNQRNSANPIVKAFNAAILELKHKHQILEYDWGYLVIYTEERHASLIKQQINSLEPWLAEEEKQVEKHRRKLANLKAELGQVEGEAEG